MIPDVVLVTGPGGAGKTTLSLRLGAALGRPVVGEDDVWVARGWGHGTRTPEHEALVQQEVLHLVDGPAVVEFILYKPAPNPLTVYEDAFAARGVATASIVLRVDPADAVGRMIGRGRENDLAALERRLIEGERQQRMAELAAPGRIVVDTTGRDADAVCAEALRRLDV